MSKAAAIKKKALEHAKKRDWDKALKEYKRLAELDAHNPNVFNELGDIHLKLGDRGPAFEAFHQAIDAYTTMHLHNNAAAVCKKVLRLNPNDSIVYGKLARLRADQGFQKEAESYADMFLDRIVQDATLKPEELKDRVMEVAEAVSASPAVLDRIADCLIKWEFKADAGPLLEKAERAYSQQGMTAEAATAQEKMSTIGYVPGPAGTDTPADGGSEDAAADEELVIDTGRADFTPPSRKEAPAGAPSKVAQEYGEVEIGSAAEAGAATESATAVEEEPQPEVPEPSEEPAAETLDSEAAEPEVEPEAEVEPEPESEPAATVPEMPDFDDDDLTRTAEIATPVEEPQTPQVEEDIAAAAVAQADDDAPASEPAKDEEIWVPADELPDELKSDSDPGGEYVKVSEIVGKFNAEVKATVDAEDYRSHYDLGMAYLEMDLISEAIREFQTASKSNQFQARCYEMIGLCFLKQDKGAPRGQAAREGSCARRLR